MPNDTTPVPEGKAKIIVPKGYMLAKIQPTGALSRQEPQWRLVMSRNANFVEDAALEVNREFPQLLTFRVWRKLLASPEYRDTRIEVSNEIDREHVINALEDHREDRVTVCQP